jgi:hypothetical protein
MDQHEENMRELFVGHVSEYHAFKAAELIVMVEEHNDMVGSMERIVNLLEGEPEVDLSGAIVGRQDDGMVERQTQMSEKIETIYERTNGGVKVTNVVDPAWTRGQKIAAGALGTSVVFAALPGFIGFFHWLAELWVL